MYGEPVPTQDMLSMYEEIKENYTTFKLVPPGHCFQVFKKKKVTDLSVDLSRKEVISCDKYIGVFLKGDFFQEILFSKTMLSDHMPNLYEKSLQQLSGQSSSTADEEQEALATVHSLSPAPFSPEETKREE